jgi:AraC-like DNA-binding protein
MIVIDPSEVRPVVRVANFFRTHDGRCNWPTRTIPDPELILICRGHFCYRRGQEHTSVKAGQVLLIEPGVEHSFGAVGPAHQGIISCIHGELIADASWAKGDYALVPSPQTVTDVDLGSGIKQMFRSAAAAFESYSPQRQQILSSVVRGIWLYLAGIWTGDVIERRSARMEEILRFVESRLFGPLGRQHIAEQFGITPEHVNYLFRRELGVTPGQFIHRERCLRAYQLIHDRRMSVKDAAQAVGYNDPFHFSRIFKQVLGRPPSQA